MTATNDDPTTRPRADVLADVFAGMCAGRSVRSIFADPDAERIVGLPSQRTFWRWLLDDEEQQKAYENALRARAERYGEEIVDIPDELAADTSKLLTPELVALTRIRVDARKWTAARLLPKKYGDRTIVAGDADNPVRFVDDSAIAGKLLPELAGGSPPATPGDADP